MVSIVRVTGIKVTHNKVWLLSIHFMSGPGPTTYMCLLVRKMSEFLLQAQSYKVLHRGGIGWLCDSDPQPHLIGTGWSQAQGASRYLLKRVDCFLRLKLESSISQREPGTNENWCLNDPKRHDQLGMQGGKTYKENEESEAEGAESNICSTDNSWVLKNVLGTALDVRTLKRDKIDRC